VTELALPSFSDLSHKQGSRCRGLVADAALVAEYVKGPGAQLRPSKCKCVQRAIGSDVEPILCRNQRLEMPQA